MNTKDVLKNVLNNNPMNKTRIKILRKKLHKHNITFFTPNCLGGILFHDLGLKFLSPTVNLMMKQTDFLEFVLHLDDYLTGEFEFFEHREYTCPCAKLKATNINESITIHFTHYLNEKEALDKWNARKKRIDKDNIFIFIEERDGITREDIQKLGRLKVKGIVAFTCNEYKDIPYAVYISKYHTDGEIGNIMQKNYLTGRREYDNYFDFVKWFNEADGAPYNVTDFCK